MIKQLIINRMKYYGEITLKTRAIWPHIEMKAYADRFPCQIN